MSFSRGMDKMWYIQTMEYCCCCLITMSDSFVTLWTVACQAPLSMGFPRQEYWNGLPFPSPGDLPDPGIEPRSPALQADSLLTETSGKPKILVGIVKMSFKKVITVHTSTKRKSAT